MDNRKPRIDALLSAAKWREEREKLREIILRHPLTEDVKWGKLCYTFDESSVALIFELKEYCAIGFLKGALLKDVDGILVKPGEHSQAMRQVRFTNVQEIAALEARLGAYLREAVDVEKAGLKVDFKEKRELELPEDLQSILGENPALKAAFEALTPGRRRGYILHVSGAKQSKTRLSRIEKCIPRILDGKGLHDR